MRTRPPPWWPRPFPDLNTDSAAGRFTVHVLTAAQNAIASNWQTAEQVLGLS